MKKHESQADELGQLKLKTVILQDDRYDETHTTEPVGFIAADLVSANG